MKMRTLLLATSCLVTVLFTISCSTWPPEQITLSVIPARQNDRLTVETADGQAVIQVFSATGIGKAEVEITSRAMPRRIVLRLHLRGLEELRFTYSSIVVMGAISGSKGDYVRQSVRGVGSNPAQEQAILPDSPYWMKMKVVAEGASEAVIPLENGYIEVEAPEDFVRGGYRQFSVQWIDFYR